MKTEVRAMKQEALSVATAQLKTTIPPPLLRSMQLCSEKGSSSWLSVLPISDHGFSLHKGAFHDALCLRYNWQPTHHPSHCICGQGFTVGHALICPTRDFPSLWHNELRDFNAKLLSKVCPNTTTEPMLQPLSGECLAHATTNWEDGAHLMFLHKASGVIDIREPFLMLRFFILIPSSTITSS